MSGLGYASAVFSPRPLLFWMSKKPNLITVIHCLKDTNNKFPNTRNIINHSLVENINCTLQIIHLSASRLDSD